MDEATHILRWCNSDHWLSISPVCENLPIVSRGTEDGLCGLLLTALKAMWQCESDYCFFFNWGRYGFGFLTWLQQ